jgi:hypothetical protein
LLTYDFINLEDLPFYFAHEIKAFIGILPLIFLVSKRLSFKKYFVFYLFLGFYFFFVFCPPSLEFLFYKIPFLNMFRIPQRLVLCIVLPIYLLIFKNKSEQPDSKIAFSILVVISALFIGLYSLTLLDFFFFFVSLLFIFPIKKASISLKTMGLIFLISNFFFLYHHPQKTSPKLVLDYTSNTQGILRSKIYNSNFWTTNTNRFVSSNSIYGYTHPLPKYRELFTKTFNVNVIDLLYFKDLPGHPLNDNFQSLYRYFSDSTLSYSPTSITNDINVFWNEFKKDKSPVAAGELAYSDVNISLIKQSLCSNQLSISNESIDNRNVFSLNVFNNFNEDCLIVIPFNFSHFLNVKNNELKSKIVPINISQIGTIVHPGKNHLVFYTNDSLYWNLKFIGFVLGLISFFTHYYYRRRYLL